MRASRASQSRVLRANPGASFAAARSSRWRFAANSASGVGSARAAERRSVAAALQAAQGRLACGGGRGRDRRHQLGPDRHRHLGGRGRRRRAHVGGEVDQRRVGLVADRRDERDRALGRGAHHHLLVERPQILDRAAAARDDQQVGPRHRAAGWQRVEAADRGRDLVGAGLALHRHRPDQHAAREAVLEPVQDVADHRAGRRGDDADHARQERQRRLRAASNSPSAASLRRRSSSSAISAPSPAGSSALDDDLVFRAARIGGERPVRDHLQPFLAA